MDFLLKIKEWQLFILLVNYWVVNIFIPLDLLVINILLVLNQVLLFGWYYSIVIKLNAVLNLRLKYIIYFKLALIYVLTFVLIEVFFSESSFFESVFWRYLAFVSFILTLVLVTSSFGKAEKSKGLKTTDRYLVFILLFLYPIGVFFISKKVKNMLGFKINRS